MSEPLNIDPAKYNATLASIEALIGRIPGAFGRIERLADGPSPRVRVELSLNGTVAMYITGQANSEGEWQVECSCASWTTSNLRGVAAVAQSLQLACPVMALLESIG